MKRLLVTARDQQELQGQLAELGGTMLMQVADNLFVVNVPASTDPPEVAGSISADRAAPELGDQAAGLASAWQDAERFMAIPPSERPASGLSWDAAGYEAPVDLDAVRQREAPETQDKDAPRYAGTSLYAVGSVAVGLVMVSGPGSLAFSSSELQTIRSQVLAAFSFLSSANPLAKLEFHIDDRPVTVDVQPPKTCPDYEDCEAPWRNAALVKMGYPGSLAGSRQYVADLIKRFGTKWGYVAYFTKYPLKHFAYSSGERLVMQYSNDGWGTGNIHSVFAHESGHIFGAADEYRSSPCYCGGEYGFFDTANCNCGKCPGDQLACLMNQNDLRLCTWSRRQIGWNAWGPQTNVTDKNEARTSAGPAAELFGSRLFVAYKGDSSTNLWMSTFDGSTWSPQVKITDQNGAKTSASPALAVLGNRLYMVYRGDSTSNLWMASFDGSRWSDQVKITDQNGAETSVGPALAAFGNRLYMVYRGDSTSNLWMASFDGSRWSDQVKITDQNDAETSASPGLAALGNRLYMVYRGASSSNMWAASFDGSKWGPQTKITDLNGAETSAGPAVQALGNNLLVAFQGKLSSNLWSCAFDGSGWLAQTSITDQNRAATSAAPALAQLGEGLQLVYKGADSGRIWSCHYAPDAPQPDRLQSQWQTC